MRRIISILFIALSVFVLLILAVIPHHHHEGAVCFAMELNRQDGDGAADDPHTPHDDTPDGDHGESCIAESVFTAANPNCEIKAVAASRQHLLRLTNLPTDDTDVEYGEYLLFYTSAPAPRVHGLRAPPPAIS